MIADSSAIILFARLNRIQLLKKLYGYIEVAESVYEESVEKGTEYGYGDAIILKKAFKEGFLKKTRLSRQHQELAANLQQAHPQLGKGEADTIALAIQNRSRTALIDEHAARIAARLQGVKCTGSIGIFLLAFSEGMLSENETKALLNTALKESFRISSAIVMEFYDALDRIKRKKGR